MTSHFQRVLLASALCLCAGTSFAQNTNNRFNGNRPNFAQGMNSGRAAMRETQIRTALTKAGFTDVATQNPIIALAKMEQAASQSLLPKINALRTALGANANDTTNTNPDTVANLFADYRSAVADTQEARATAISDLDKSVSFSTNPTLEALLTMLGIIGDETGFVSNLAGQAQLPGAGGGGRNGGGPGGMGGMMGGPAGMNGGMGNGGGPGGMGGMAPPPLPDGN